MYWINLPEATERREHMERQLVALGVPNRRVSAYCEGVVSDVIRPMGGGDRTVRELACLCSHLEAIRRALNDARESGYDDCAWVVIAEDDVVINRAYDFGAVAATAPKGAELLQLSVMHSGALEGAWVPEVRTMWRAWIPWHYGAQLYMVRVGAVEKALARLGLDTSRALHDQPGRLDVRKVRAAAVADDMLFRLFRTFNTRVPFSSGDIRFGSSIHESHLAEHEEFWRAIDAYTKIPPVKALLDGFAVPTPA